MYGMRNRLVHDYEGIRLQIVWETISTDFPSLKTSLDHSGQVINNPPPAANATGGLVYSIEPVP